jgi:plasmid stabilization system protein ParE
MSFKIEKSPFFHLDVTNQFRWYSEEAGNELAWRFFHTVDETLFKLARQPDLGRKRRFRNPMLQGLWSYRVEPPFKRFLIFYRVTEGRLGVWRLVDGARDLPRRLREEPSIE